MGARGSGGHARSGERPKKGTAARVTDAIVDVKPPAGLPEPAAEYWNYYAPILRLRKLWTSSSRDVLRNYCAALVLRDRLEAELAVLPLAFIVPKTDADGNHSEEIKANPLLAQVRAVRLECRQHANDLCLPPAAAVRTPMQEDDEPSKGPAHDFYGDKPKPSAAARGARLN